MYNFIKVSESR